MASLCWSNSYPPPLTCNCLIPEIPGRKREQATYKQVHGRHEPTRFSPGCATYSKSVLWKRKKKKACILCLLGHNTHFITTLTWHGWTLWCLRGWPRSQESCRQQSLSTSDAVFAWASAPPFPVQQHPLHAAAPDAHASVRGSQHSKGPSCECSSKQAAPPNISQWLKIAGTQASPCSF